MTTECIGNRRRFARLPGGGYSFTLMDDSVRIEGRHLRREHHQLYGEVDVLCDWAGVQTTHDGKLSSAELNFSSQTQRVARGKYCQQRAKTKVDDFDWIGAIDDFCCRVIEAERNGSPAIVLDDAPAEGPPQDFTVHGLSIPADSHSMLIADGGGLKSLLLLELVLGEMAQRGMPVVYCDWEWSAARHLARKRRLFGPDRLDHLHYMACRSPLTVELDRIRRFCEEQEIQFLGIDSVSAACDGKLADDDVARAYNRALGDLPPSLSAAHIPKAIDPKADLKAFGSAFFHNFCRVSWTVKKQAAGEDEDVVVAGLFPHKQNDGPRLRPVGLRFTFAPDTITVCNVDVAAVDGLAESLPLAARMRQLLKRGPMSYADLASELDAKVDSVIKAATRGGFTKILSKDGIQRLALVARNERSR